jgi:protein phosphatase 1L
MGEGLRVRSAIASDQRWRERMEDRALAEPLAAGTLLAVFDGHGGASVADHARAHARDAVEDGLAAGLRDAALWSAVFARLDASLDRCGSTATLALVLDRRLSVGWVGDSRALLVRTEGHDAVTADHRLERADERRRVRRAGADFDGPYVVDPRSGQGLMMTRSLGDRGLRHVGIVAEPECRTRPLAAGDVAVVLGTDGLWDVLDEAEVAAVARAVPEPGAVAGRLVTLVAERGGRDNVTVVVARLDHHAG